MTHILELPVSKPSLVADFAHRAAKLARPAVKALPLALARSPLAIAQAYGTAFSVLFNTSRRADDWSDPSRF